MSTEIKHIPVTNLNEKWDMSKEEFKEASKEIGELFKKLKDLIYNYHLDWDNTDTYNGIIKLFREDLYGNFKEKYQVDGLTWTTGCCNREMKIISLKFAVLDDMCRRYYDAALEKINREYIHPKTESQICKIMIEDKTGYIRSKVQVHDLMKYMMLHEIKMRMNRKYRKDMFPNENKYGKFYATYRKTCIYFNSICPDKINPIDIIWQII